MLHLHSCQLIYANLHQATHPYTNWASPAEGQSHREAGDSTKAENYTSSSLCFTEKTDQQSTNKYKHTHTDNGEWRWVGGRKERARRKQRSWPKNSPPRPQGAEGGTSQRQSKSCFLFISAASLTAHTLILCQYQWINKLQPVWFWILWCWRSTHQWKATLCWLWCLKQVKYT